MDGCLFCRIVNQADHFGHEIIWESDTHLAFLDRFPNSRAALVIITKDHHPGDLLQLDDTVLTGLLLASKAVNALIKKAFPDVDRIGLVLEGYGVDHAHFKGYVFHGTRNPATGEVIIIKSPIKLYNPGSYQGFMMTNASLQGDPVDLRVIADRIRAAA